MSDQCTAKTLKGGRCKNFIGNNNLHLCTRHYNITKNDNTADEMKKTMLLFGKEWSKSRLLFEPNLVITDSNAYFILNLANNSSWSDVTNQYNKAKHIFNMNDLSNIAIKNIDNSYKYLKNTREKDKDKLKLEIINVFGDDWEKIASKQNLDMNDEILSIIFNTQDGDSLDYIEKEYQHIFYTLNYDLKCIKLSNYFEIIMNNVILAYNYARNVDFRTLKIKKEVIHIFGKEWELLAGNKKLKINDENAFVIFNLNNNASRDDVEKEYTEVFNILNYELKTDINSEYWTLLMKNVSDAYYYLKNKFQTNVHVPPRKKIFISIYGEEWEEMISDVDFHLNDINAYLIFNLNRNATIIQLERSYNELNNICNFTIKSNDEYLNLVKENINLAYDYLYEKLNTKRLPIKEEFRQRSPLKEEFRHFRQKFGEKNGNIEEELDKLDKTAKEFIQKFGQTFKKKNVNVEEELDKLDKTVKEIKQKFGKNIPTGKGSSPLKKKV